MLVDSLVIVALLIFFLIGYKKGVVSEFISFSALLFNIVLSREITPFIAERINITIDNKFYDIFVYSGIFVATYIFFMGTIKFMLRTITVNERLFIDKITGAFLGLAKAVLINILFLLVLLVISKFDEGVEEELEESKIYELSYRFNDESMLFLPQEINDMINKFDYEREIEKAIKAGSGGGGDAFGKVYEQLMVKAPISSYTGIILVTDCGDNLGWDIQTPLSKLSQPVEVHCSVLDTDGYVAKNDHESWIKEMWSYYDTNNIPLHLICKSIEKDIQTKK